MTKTIRFGAAGIAMFAALGMGSVAHAQDSATADARAEVLVAIDLQSTGVLDFGAIVLDGGGVQLELAPDGTLNCPANGVFCRGTTSTPTFTATGTADQTAFIVLPSAPVTLSIGGSAAAADTMTITNFLSDAPATDSLNRPLITLTGGTASFNVGGTLNVGTAQNPGVYEGTFEVTVDYS